MTDFPMNSAGTSRCVLVCDFVHNLFHEFLDEFRADRTFLTCLFDAIQQLVFREILSPSITLGHHQCPSLDFFVSGEAETTSRAFSTAPNRGTLARGSRIDHFVILTRTLGTSHSSPLIVGARIIGTISRVVKKQKVPARPCGQTGTKWGMGVRHALFPVLTFGASPRRAASFPTLFSTASGVFGLVAGPSSAVADR